MMNKARLEGLSDNVFSIAMTLLAIDIRLPDFPPGSLTNAQLWLNIVKLFPLFEIYFLSFAILAMLWFSHHALFHFFTRNVNRKLVHLNMLYLALIAFIPFSAYLLGRYGSYPASALFYGMNILLIEMVSVWMFRYALASHEIDTSHAPADIIERYRASLSLTVVCTLIGMGVASGFPSLAHLFFVLPIIFNFFPKLTLSFLHSLGLRFR